MASARTRAGTGGVEGPLAPGAAAAQVKAAMASSIDGQGLLVGRYGRPGP